jgi:hypothetical protein
VYNKIVLIDKIDVIVESKNTKGKRMPLDLGRYSIFTLQ